MEFYAKSSNKNKEKVGETLQEHTEALLDRFNEFKKIYGENIDALLKNESENHFFWDDLKLACIIHDLGKISTPFQNKIRKILKLPMLDESSLSEIPHNFLSPAFLTGLDKINDFRFYIIFFTIAFHHDRKIEFKKNEMLETIETDLKKNFVELELWLNSKISNYHFEKPYISYYSDLLAYVYKNKDEFNKIKKTKNFILLKGLLHRFDHSASAYIPIEEGKLENTSQKLIKYLKTQPYFTGLKKFQKNAVNLRGDSVLLTASTGLGKTEFAINWLGNSKSFYTLPLRVSTNAMFARLTKIFGDNVGILHSDSYNLLQDDEKLSIEENLHRFNVSKQLAKPIMVTTADQLFISVFKWPGYEKIYSTLFYSKIVLDEPQSYSPKTLAMIIRALEELSSYGGKFCYMSATNHPFILNKLKYIAKELPPVFNSEKKHKITLNEDSLENLIPEIEKKYYQGKKILVITNTVKKGQELFNKFNNKINKKLLHSGFIKRDRSLKEKEIQEDYKLNIPVIWISTQIVEASLDIDYDMLFTEIATLDALIQRMGRINRRKGRIIKNEDDPNIFIASDIPSDQYYVYNKEICEYTKLELQKYNNKILTEELKQDIMNKVYDEKRIKNTKYFEEYNSAYELLQYGFETDSKSEAQNLFREISQINGIPIAIYETNSSLIDNLIDKIKEKYLNFYERIKINQKLMDLTLSIPAWKAKKCIKLNSERKMSLYLIPGDYNHFEGLKYKEIENIF
jgi:CRISPR-associated endonuclease/helicase Cas3